MRPAQFKVTGKYMYFHAVDILWYERNYGNFLYVNHVAIVVNR